MDFDIVLSRHSVRRYLKQSITHDAKRDLIDFINEINTSDKICFSLVTDSPEAFATSWLARYGHFEEVRNYVVVAGKKHTSCELGYWGEHIVLKARQLGLDTCWVGMSYNSSKVNVVLPDGFKIYALIALGYGVDHGKPHKTKSARTLCRNYDEAPDFIRRGTEWACFAPSAFNQQKFRFKWCGDNRVEVTPGFGFYVKIDMGIAMCHFELGAGRSIDWLLRI